MKWYYERCERRLGSPRYSRSGDRRYIFYWYITRRSETQPCRRSPQPAASARMILVAKRLFRAGIVLGLAATLGAPWPALAQESLANAPEPTRAVKAPVLPGGLPEKPSQPPAFTVAVEALGFSAPGPLYLGQRASFVSLDFLDENRLLFTFRVPGLIRREAGEEIGRAH